MAPQTSSLLGTIKSRTKKALEIEIEKVENQKLKYPTTLWIPIITIKENSDLPIGAKAKFEIINWKMRQIRTEIEEINYLKSIKPLVNGYGNHDNIRPLIKEILPIDLEIIEIEAKLEKLRREKERINREIINLTVDNDYLIQSKGLVYENNEYSRFNFNIKYNNVLMSISDLFENFGDDIYKVEKTLKSENELRDEFGIKVFVDNDFEISIESYYQQHSPVLISLVDRKSMISPINHNFIELTDGTMMNLLATYYAIDAITNEAINIDDHKNSHWKQFSRINGNSYFKYQMNHMDIVYIFKGDESLGKEYFEAVINVLHTDPIIHEFCNTIFEGAVDGRIQNRYEKLMQKLYTI